MQGTDISCASPGLPQAVQALPPRAIIHPGAPPTPDWTRLPVIVSQPPEARPGHVRRGWAALRLAAGLAAFAPAPARAQAVTEVQYRDGHAAEAIRLAAGLKPGVVVIRNDALAPNVDVRLVLGRDAWAESDLLRKNPPGRESIQLVAGKTNG